MPKKNKCINCSIKISPYYSKRCVVCSNKIKNKNPQIRAKISATMKGKPAHNKGIPQSIEHKENISRALRGKKKPFRTIEHRKNQSKSQMGNSHRKGKPSSLSARLLISGERNHSWKGGITPLVRRIRNLTEMKKWRIKVFERDDYTCQYCETKSGNGKAVYLEADHIKTFSDIFAQYNFNNIQEAINCKELWEIDNGRTLCRECHNETKV